MSPEPLEITEIDSLADLLPAFEFERLLAQGGMGAVYKARQRSLDRDVAIKILPRELGDDPLFRCSFQAEAKAMARLNHPNLIRVYDSGDLDGLLYIVMEYVPGKSLHHCAHRIAIDSKQAVEIITAACRGLAHAHEQGIVHRDIKPANILLTLKCEPKIGDFGLARSTRTDIDGLAMGTPGYMAPELISHPEKGDAQSDVYAMGVVLRELLTGIPAGTGDAAQQVVSDPTLAEICRKATHADPAMRYPDVSSLAAQLTRWMAAKTSKSIVTTTQSVSQRPKPLMHRPSPASQRPMPTSLAKQGPSGHWAILKNCAIITLLLSATYLTLGIYQTGHGGIARQSQERNNKPPTQSDRSESKAVARITTSRDLAGAPSDALDESSFQSLVRLGTALSSGDSK